MTQKGVYSGPRSVSDSTYWWRSFCGRYQSVRATVRALQIEAETKKLPGKRSKSFDHAVACLDAAFDALNSTDLRGQRDG